MKNRLDRFLVNGNKIKQFRKEQQIRVSEVARKSKFEQGTIEKLEEGGVFYWNTINAVCRVLDVKPELLGLQRQTERTNEPPEFLGLRALVGSSIKPMYFTDTDQVIQHVNRPLEQLVGYNREEIVGLHIKMFLNLFKTRVPKEMVPSFVKKEKRLLKKAEAGGVNNLFDVVVIAQPGLPAESTERMKLIEIRGERVRNEVTDDHVASLVYYDVRTLSPHQSSQAVGDHSVRLTDGPERVKDRKVSKGQFLNNRESPLNLRLPSLAKLTPDERMKKATELLEQFDWEISDVRTRAIAGFQSLLTALVELVGDGADEGTNEALIKKLNAIPKTFGASLTCNGSPISLRHYKGVFEARSKDSSRKIKASGKKMIPLSCELVKDD